MTSTSEFEPPASEHTPLADIPDEGPLDPSVFDGLFDDLGDEEPAPLDEVDQVDGLVDAPAHDDLLGTADPDAPHLDDLLGPAEHETFTEDDTDGPLLDDLDDLLGPADPESYTEDGVEAPHFEEPIDPIDGVVESNGALMAPAEPTAEPPLLPELEQPFPTDDVTADDGTATAADLDPLLDDAEPFAADALALPAVDESALAPIDPVVADPDHLPPRLDEDGFGLVDQPVLDAEGFAPTDQPALDDEHLRPALDHDAFAPTDQPALDHERFAPTDQPALDDEGFGPTDQPALDHDGFGLADLPALDTEHVQPALDDEAFAPTDPPAFVVDADALAPHQPDVEPTGPSALDAAAFGADPGADLVEVEPIDQVPLELESTDLDILAEGLHHHPETPAARFAPDGLLDEQAPLEVPPAMPPPEPSPPPIVEDPAPVAPDPVHVPTELPDPARPAPAGEAIPIDHPVAEQEVPADWDPRLRPAQPSRRWPAFAIAIMLGAVLGIGGALVLSQVVTTEDPQQATPPTVTVTVTVPVEVTPGEEGSTEVVSGATTLTNLAATGRFELNTLRFVPGTETLTDGSQVLLQEVAAAAASQAVAPLTIVVRTYSEQTAAANLELSRRQAAVVVDQLVSLGLPASAIRAAGIGSPPMTPAQPVRNFVVVGSGLRPSALRDTIQGLPPFAIGVDPVTNQLRPESYDPLDALGAALLAEPGTAISLAAYSFEEPDTARNAELAGVAAEAAAAYLVATHGVERQRISVLTLGQALYIAAPNAGNHISLQWGDDAAVATALDEASTTAITFDAGSTTLGDEAVAALLRVAAAAIEADMSLVVAVHTATEPDAEANAALSELQAEAIRQRLVADGMPEERVRAFGVGNARQFGADTGPAAEPSRVVITPLR